MLSYISWMILISVIMMNITGGKLWGSGEIKNTDLLIDAFYRWALQDERFATPCVAYSE